MGFVNVDKTSYWPMIVIGQWFPYLKTPSKPISVIKIKLFEQRKKHSISKLTWRKSVSPILEKLPILKKTGKFLNFQLRISNLLPTYNPSPWNKSALTALPVAKIRENDRHWRRGEGRFNLSRIFSEIVEQNSIPRPRSGTSLLQIWIRSQLL